MLKHYHVDVRIDCHDIPLLQCVDFSIEATTAEAIIHLSTQVKANGWQRIEQWDARARFFRFDRETHPDDAREAGPDNEIPTECGSLNVTADAFWFAACLSHSTLKVRSQSLPISEIAAFFHRPWPVQPQPAVQA